VSRIITNDLHHYPDINQHPRSRAPRCLDVTRRIGVSLMPHEAAHSWPWPSETAAPASAWSKDCCCSQSRPTWLTAH